MSSINNSDPLVPSCMEELGNNQYRCKKLGFVVTTTQLPIRCFLCGGIPKPPAMPGILEMAKNVTKAAVNFAMDGFKRVTEDQYNQRLEQCNKNECGQFVKGRCAKCGCFLIPKAWAHSEECPLGYWKKIEI